MSRDPISGHCLTCCTDQHVYRTVLPHRFTFVKWEDVQHATTTSLAGLLHHHPKHVHQGLVEPPNVPGGV